MSARKASATAFNRLTFQARQTRLSLSHDAVIFHKGGLEFRSSVAFSPWADMVVTLESPRERGRVHCSGVVISCTGNRHAGYHVSMILTGLSPQAEARLSEMAFSQLS